MIKQFGTLLAITLSTLASAQPMHTKSAWHPVDELPIAAEAAAKSQAFLYRSFQLDPATLRLALSAAPIEPVGGFDLFASAQAHSVIDIPMPDGSTQRFAVVETPCMEPELAARHPSMRSYVGESIESPGTVLRCSQTQRGFHAMITAPGAITFVNPAAADPIQSTEHYISFRQEDAADSGMPFDCTVLGDADTPFEDRAVSTPLRGANRNDMVVAYLPTAEWALLHGSSVETSLSALVVLTTRLNAIYEHELCVRFLIANEQDQLIQFDPATDGLTNNDSATMLAEAAAVYDRLASALECEMRHVLGTYGGGVAYRNSSCTEQAAVTSSGLPVENLYSVRVVAHEMGHQFSSPHTFSGRGELCNSNWGTCTEPGGGSTIMAYAHQCYPDNIVSEADLQFHAHSLPGMATRANCGSTVALGNTAPDISISPSLVLIAPSLTPLMLSCETFDAEGDQVTLSFDQIGTNSCVALKDGDRGNNAIFRTFLPSADTVRVFPRWQTLLNNEPSPGETMPNRARSALTFRIFARDNRPGGAASSYRDVAIQIRQSSSQTFALTSQQDGRPRIAGPHLVTWNVFNTTAAPYNLANVEILLMRSDDDRNPLVIAPSTPNDGSESVTFPDEDIERARIIVRPINAVFFDVSRKPFPVIARRSGPDFRLAAPPRFTDDFAEGNANGRIDSGEAHIRILVPALNAGTEVMPDGFGRLVSQTPTARVRCDYGFWLPLEPGATAENVSAFVLDVASDHPCGAPIDLELVLLEGTPQESHLAFQFPTANPQTFSTITTSYAGNPVPIPDGDPSGVAIPVTVGELPGPVTDVKFRILGFWNSNPDTLASGLTHPYVGDLVLKLTNPQGATITLADRPGGVGNFGKNFADTLFDMKQIVSYIQSAIPRRAPYNGVFFPKDDLNLLAGDGGSGTWIFSVADMRSGQWPEPPLSVGSAVRQFAVELTCRQPQTCAAPFLWYCPGNFQSAFSGVVDDEDFGVFVVAYNQLFSTRGDMNGDMLTDDADFTLFVQAYDQFTCPQP